MAVGLDLSKVTVGPGPSYGSFGSCCWLNILIMSCDKPIGLFGVEEPDVVVAVVVVVLDWRDCGPVRVLVDEVVLGAVVGDVDLADVCGPVRALAEVLGAAVGKKLSDVLTTGENLIFVCLASLPDSFSSLSCSELYTISSGFLYQSG